MTPEERAEKIDAIIEHIRGRAGAEPIPLAAARMLISLAIEEAVQQRDFEWWEAVIGVDNVAPTPEAGKQWCAWMGEMAAEQERQACIKDVLSSSFHDGPRGTIEGQIAKAIRARAVSR